MNNPIQGTITAMVTPLDDAGRLDAPVAGRLASWLADRGVDGLFIGGTTGEGVLLDLEEREALTEAVVSTVSGRVKVLVQAGCATTMSSIRLARHTLAAGADGAAVLSPFFHGVDRTAMIDHFSAVAAAAPELPVYLYNIPGNTKNPITPEIVAAVLERSPNLAGIKDSSKDLALLQKFVALAPEGFGVLVGSDSMLLPGLVEGAVGGVSAASTAFPEPVVAVVKAFRSGDLPAAREAQVRLNKLLGLLKIGPTPAGYKAALARRGLPVGDVRPPLRGLTKDEQARFDAAFDAVWGEYARSLQ